MYIMNNKQRKVLRAIFEEPIQVSLKWSEIENLLDALGAKLIERKGSRLRVSLNEVRRVFHRPHPENVAGKARIKDVRNFLENAGVTDANI